MLHKFYRFSVRSSRENAAGNAAASKTLSLAEGLAVGALILGGVGFMGSHQDPVQRAVVLVLAVICALLDGTFDALVGIVIHKEILLFIWVQN